MRELSCAMKGEGKGETKNEIFLLKEVVWQERGEKRVSGGGELTKKKKNDRSFLALIVAGLQTRGGGKPNDRQIIRLHPYDHHEHGKAST